jgi:hypothetical protein
MRRSITCVGLTLGTVALLALGTGCRHKEQQAPPSAGTTTEPTAPATNEPGTTTPQPGMTTPQPGMTTPQPGMTTPQPGATKPPGAQSNLPVRPGNEYGAGLPGETGQAPGEQGQAPGTETPYGQPGQQQGAQPGQPGQPQAQPPPAGEPTATAGGNEREMCDSLATAAKLHVEDVQHGVAIVMVPRQGTTLSNLSDDAHKVQQSIQQHAQPQAGGEPCGIFALGRLPSVNTSVSEGKTSVRIVMTTTNPSEVRDLRRMTREQVGMLTKGAQSNPQHQR